MSKVSKIYSNPNFKVASKRTRQEVFNSSYNMIQQRFREIEDLKVACGLGERYDGVFAPNAMEKLKRLEDKFQGYLDRLLKYQPKIEKK